MLQRRQPLVRGVGADFTFISVGGFCGQRSRTAGLPPIRMLGIWQAGINLEDIPAVVEDFKSTYRRSTEWNF